ncbi:BTAD domain-containing putative transcriptional regulator [Paenisporosarcina sp. TG-14]|uniref:BTAD domain-containing putative transcriptional regulator n=1 Tax=Paenisporosarcina sp. TG-14 TaxID=1231057 RepID=UPI000306A557|nr:BTAD domain-containing putative transcriptional regulator [Paenisporosarcina sp. TG-14]
MEVPLLKSKIVPPVTSETYMRRASLTRTFKQISSKKSALISGGAGYGKSSAIAQFIADSRINCSWYTVSSEDDDLVPFLRYLIGSIQRIVPSFGQQLLKDLSIQPSFTSDKELITWHAWFVSELDQIAEPLVIVIDDYHLIDHVFSINFMVERIIEHCPSYVHIVLISRSKPKWTQLLKLKMSGQLIEVNEKDLVFTEEEIIVYFEDYFERHLTKEESKYILEITEGWAIAIQLMAVKSVSEDSSFNVSLKPAMEDLFHYLSEEVFSRYKEEEQSWLMQFSVFLTFSLKFIQLFFGKEAVHFLQSFRNQHGFIQQLGEDSVFRYHTLFQQYLITKWKNTNLAGFQKAHKLAAEHFEQKSDSIRSIYHALQSKDVHFITQIVLKTVPKLLKLGQFDLIIDSLKEIPQSYFDEFPALYYFEGEANRYLAYYEKSKQAYQKSLLLATAKKDAFYSSYAHAGLAHIYLDTIQPGLADPHLANAISFANQTETMSQKDMNNLKRQFAENLVNLGKTKEAKTFIEDEQLPETLLINGNLDARILLRMGKLSDSLQLLENRLKEEDMVPDSHRETAVLLALLNAMIGNLSQASYYATKGIESGIREKSKFVEAVGLIRKGHAESVDRHHFLDSPDSERMYLQAIEKMDQLNVSRGKAEPYLGLALLKAKQGFQYEALILAEKGLIETERVQDAWLSAFIKIGITIIYCTFHQYDQANSYAKQAKVDFTLCGDSFGKMVASFWLSICAFELEDKEQFSQEIKQFAHILLEEQYIFFIEKITMYGPLDIQQFYPLIQYAMKNCPDNEEIHRIGQHLQVEQHVIYPGYTLHVQLLGPISISLGREEVEDRKWQREKAKDLFVYLFIHKNRFVPKEELVSELFGDQDEKTAVRDFKVALNALYNVLEPKRFPRAESYFIIRKQTMYRIHPKAAIVSDVEKFQQLVAQGLDERNPQQASALLKSAIALYRGTYYLNQNVYNWFQFEQDHFHQMYLQVIEKLAQNATRLQQFNQTIYWAEKLIKLDYTWEEAYRLLMYAHYQKNNRSQAIKWYEKCVQMLLEEYELKPMETTERMFELIANGYA